MNSKIKNVFQNVSYSVLANGINTLVSMVLVFIVPKALGVREYSYWQLYTFYVTYTGFFHFGWADGIYLKFGGKKYEELDKTYFNRQFWLLTFFEILIALVIGAVAYFGVDDSQKQIVLILTGTCCILQLPRTLLQYILQITDRIKDYAKNYMLEKIVYAVCVLSMLALGQKNFVILISADLFARLVTLVLLCIQCKDMVFRKLSCVGIGVRASGEHIAIGSKLMFANIAGLLINGIVRFAIENHWNVETFGKVSLTMTMSNMLMVFISAVSVVIYPMLKQTPEERLAQMYKTIRMMLMIPVLGMLLVYYPAKVLLSGWLPQYAESLKYMALLFPMCVYESKVSLLINTYLKALRKEKMMMYINWGIVVISCIITGVVVYVLDNLTLSIVSLTVILALRCNIAEIYLIRTLKISSGKTLLFENGLALIFIVSSWMIQSWFCMLIYGAAYLAYLFYNKENLRPLIEQMRDGVFRKIRRK